MKYRELGKTGLMLSEIGLGAEWLERHNRDEVKAVVESCEAHGINILDCWMSEPNVRTNLGLALAGRREKWLIQGHVGSTWNGQYVRSREMPVVKAAFQDFLDRFQTDYVDIGMIHYVDEVADFNGIMNGPFIDYIRELKENGTIRTVGLSTHNPNVGKMAALCGEVDMILFSINPAFDMRPPSENIDDMFADEYDGSLSGVAPERAELYKICEREGVGINVMKGYAGGRLFNAEQSPFGVALSPVQCLHYALTRPAVCSVLAGVETPEQVEQAVAYETATDAEKDYSATLASAPKHAYTGQCLYCGHCAPCPVGIDVAMVNKLYDLAVMQEIPASTVVAHYEALSATASDCIGCQECETRCPFSVRVAERMMAARKVFSR
ncbi:MAG: aldo/keto reductase [Planctomycetia bacterium]|nr:aldo/keto reductase [Planctomycetia bacterium]